MSVHEGAYSYPGGVKRQRVSVACDACRGRKSRCDGARPRCATCEQMGADCTYHQPVVTISAAPRGTHQQQQQGNESLEDRIKSLEEKLRTFQEAGLQPPPRRTYNTSTHAPTPPRHLDKMVKVLPIEAEVESGYFGASSNIVFLKQITRVLLETRSVDARGEKCATNARDSPTSVDTVLTLLLDNSMSTEPHELHSTAGGGGRAGGGADVEVEDDIYALPPEPEADKLLQEYFSTIALFVPCINPDYFMDRYAQFRQGTLRSVGRIWQGLLNIVFALATITVHGSSPTTARATEADRYYRRALALTNITSTGMHAASLEQIQLLLLITIYLESTVRPSQVWSFHALVVKAALQNGLASRGTFGKMTLSDRELRKRIWHCIVDHDRMVSTSFGRPSMIPESYVIKDLPVDLNEDVPAAHVSKIVESTTVSFFHALISLSKINRAILDQLYDNNLGHGDPLSVYDVASRNFSLCSRLTEWQNSLPPALSLINSKLHIDMGVSIEIIRFQTNLSLRYYYLRLLAHRAIVLKLMYYIPTPNEKNSDHLFLRQSAPPALTNCIDCCVQTVSIVEGIIDISKGDVNINGAWWILVHFIFLACITLLGILLSCENCGTGVPLLSPTVVESAEHALHRGMLVLEALNLHGDNPAILICRRFLNAMLQLYRSSSITGPMTLPTYSLLEQQQQQQQQQHCPDEAGLPLVHSKQTTNWQFPIDVVGSNNQYMHMNERGTALEIDEFFKTAAEMDLNFNGESSGEFRFL